MGSSRRDCCLRRGVQAADGVAASSLKQHRVLSTVEHPFGESAILTTACTFMSEPRLLLSLPRLRSATAISYGSAVMGTRSRPTPSAEGVPATKSPRQRRYERRREAYALSKNFSPPLIDFALFEQLSVGDKAKAADLRELLVVAAALVDHGEPVSRVLGRFSAVFWKRAFPRHPNPSIIRRYFKIVLDAQAALKKAHERFLRVETKELLNRFCGPLKDLDPTSNALHDTEEFWLRGDANAIHNAVREYGVMAFDLNLVGHVVTAWQTACNADDPKVRSAARRHLKAIGDDLLFGTSRIGRPRLLEPQTFNRRLALVVTLHDEIKLMKRQWQMGNRTSDSITVKHSLRSEEFKRMLRGFENGLQPKMIADQCAAGRESITPSGLRRYFTLARSRAKRRKNSP